MEISFTEETSRNDEETMLVDIAEFVNLPKGVIFRGGAGLKGLELLGFLFSGRTDTLYYSYSSGFIRKPRSSLDLVNGK